MQESFKIGQTVRALRSLPPNLLEGAHYTVVHVLPEYSGDGVFTWPAIITVVGKDGRKVSAHAHRFALVH